MEDKVKEILEFHTKNHPGTKIVEVTTTRWCEIPVGSYSSDSEIIDEWFNKTSINRSHAFRDGSLIIEKFNNDAKVLDNISSKDSSL